MESNVQTEIINYIEKVLKGYCVKIIRCNKNGFPDLHFLINGVPYYCEVKQKGKTARPLQEFRIKEINKFGGIAFQSDSLQDFKQQLLKFC